MNIDPDILALTDGPAPDPSFFPWPEIEAATGCPREVYFAGMANMLIMEGERMLAGYLAQPDRARGARHLAISEGCIDAPAKAKPMSDGEKFGLHRKAVAA